MVRKGRGLSMGSGWGPTRKGGRRRREDVSMQFLDYVPRPSCGCPQPPKVYENRSTE
jgi:hypothetical protein